MSVSVRFACPEDAERIRQFIHELAAFQKHAADATVTAETLRAQLESDNPPFECLIAEIKGRAVGFAVFYRTYSTWKGMTGIHLDDLYVADDARSAGVGRVLFLKLVEIARLRGCEKIDWAVINWNSGAARFYESLGAKPVTEFVSWQLDEDGLRKLEDSLQSAMAAW